jgi:hypothetical protein
LNPEVLRSAFINNARAATRLQRVGSRTEQPFAHGRRMHGERQIPTLALLARSTDALHNVRVDPKTVYFALDAVREA